MNHYYADPAQALRDVRDAHEWATRELEGAEPQSTRAWNLTQERKRLAGIAWDLKRSLGR